MSVSRILGRVSQKSYTALLTAGAFSSICFFFLSFLAFFLVSLSTSFSSSFPAPQIGWPMKPKAPVASVSI